MLGEEHRLTNKLNALRTVAKNMVGDPKTRVHYAGKGMMQVIDEISDDVFSLEDELAKKKDADYWREKNSGFGRGDSMG